MKTPSGRDCGYFYGDYFRGKNLEECRLLKEFGLVWQASYCQSCPIPEIVQANACENMQFTPTLKRPLPLMKKQVQIDTFCTKCNCQVKTPHIGCGKCHPLLDTFKVGTDDTNAPD